MPKRSRDESVDNKPDAVTLASKRTKPDSDSSPLQLLLDNADELISCIRQLQSEQERIKNPSAVKYEEVGGSSEEKLYKLAQVLVPALQGLAGASPNTVPQTNGSGLMRIPSPATFTKWTFSTVSQTFPPLPQVLDKALETAALTHSGMATRLSDATYERLEWLGDSYLYVIATELIYQTFPTMGPGRCAQLRERLVRNSTLAAYSVEYGLDKRANFPEEFGLAGRVGGTSASDKQRQKALGDIFEAYIGAIILSDPDTGVQRAANWVKALWGREIWNEIRAEETKKPQSQNDISPKTELERAIGVKGVKIEYRDLPCSKKDRATKLPLFTIGCYFTGWGEQNKQLAFGTALSKKEAGAMAAQRALDNTKMIQVYINKKKAYMEAQAAQKNAAGDQTGTKGAVVKREEKE